MIWKIAKKELLLDLMTFRFAVGTALCVVLVVLFAYVSVGNYQQRLEGYNNAIRQSRDELREARVYSQVKPTVYKPPEVLSIFSEGMEKRLGNSAKIELGSVPEVSASYTAPPPADLLSTRLVAEVSAGYTIDNPLLSIFPSFDISLIFKVVMSILALLFAYDAISGEKEQGTLRLMLSGTVARHQVLLGKLIAGLLTLAIPITIAFIAGLAVLQFSPMVGLKASDWIRIGLIFVVSLIFVSAMFNFGLWFSCLTKKSSTTLMFVLFFWVVFAFVIPNAGVYLATQLREAAPAEEIDVAIKALQEELAKKLIVFCMENEPKNSVIYGMSSLDGNIQILNAPRETMRFYQKFNAFAEPLRLNYADRAWDILRGRYLTLKHQKDLADYLSMISPISLYGKVMTALSGTDISSYERFADRVRGYRREFIQFLACIFHIPEGERTGGS